MTIANLPVDITGLPTYKCMTTVFSFVQTFSVLERARTT